MTIKINIKWIRFFGIAGMLGGIILFIGDMLFYYSPNSTDFLQNMAVTSDARIIASGVCALLTSWLYLLGAGQVYYAFKIDQSKAKYIVFFSFASIGIAYGIVHAAYLAIAISAKLALANQLDMLSSVELARNANNMLRNIIYPIFALLSVVFITQVWRKKTRYPKWMVFAFPLLPFLLEGLIINNLSGSLKIIISGGYLNIIFFIFFLASSISLWKETEQKKS